MSDNNDKKISQLPEADTLTGSELIPAVQDGVTVFTTAADIANLASMGEGGGVSSVNGDVGPAVILGAEDINTGLMPLNYSPVDASVNGHLQGIDVALASAGAVESVNGQTGEVVLTKTDVDLANVDNTSDVNKPVSTATQSALDLKADTSSLADVATTGDYDDLLNKPVLPTVARFAHLICVDKDGGNDSTGDGSFSKPYATINRAMADVPTTGTSLTNSFTIFLSPGAHSTPTLAMKPFTNIVGLGYLQTRINVASNQVTLDTSSSMFTGNSRIGFYNLSFSGSTGFAIDTSALSASSLVIDGAGCWINGASSFIGRTNGADFLEFDNFFFFSDFLTRRFQGELNGSTVAGTTTIDCAGYLSFEDTLFELAFSRISAVVVTSDATRTQKLSLDASQVSSVNANGASIEVTGDALSTPSFANVTLAGGAQFLKLQDFARRVPVPVLASSPGLTGDYATDANYRYDCIATNTWVRVPVSTF